MRQLVLSLLVLGLAAGCRPSSTPPASAPSSAASSRNGGLVLPDGFEATVFHPGVGRARHMAVTPDGIVYITLRGPARGQTPEQFKGLVALRDTGGDGRADQTEYFGDYQDTGDYGTGLRIFEDHLYFATAGEEYRQKLQAGTLVPTTPVEMILKHNYRQPGRSYEHIAKPIAFDDAGHLYVPFGAPGDACQDRNRQPGAPGADPCGQLEMHGGVWQFDARKVGQTEKDGKRYATGIRSLVAMTWNPFVKDLYALQHGRDDLYRSWPQYFSRWQSAVLPAEEFFRVTEGFDGGWPYYYYDWMQGKKLLNPEYGGDGRKEGKGPSLARPLVGFPGHYAPNDLLFYDGTLFPERYRQGAFIAFHGSTIRMPYSQAGYIVAFVPLKDGKPSGDWEVFADGFAGIDPIPNTGDAAARPMGLAQGADGALYVTESVNGKVWRVTYSGDRTTFGTRQLATMARRKAQQQHIRNPHETDDVIGKEIFVAGAKIYDTYCASCHQRDAKGDGARFPPLARTNWVSGNKQRLISIVVHGLNGEIEVEGRRYNDVMPAHPFLTDEQIAQLLTYLRQNFGNFGQGVLKDEVTAVRARAPWTPQSQPQRPGTPQTPSPAPPPPASPAPPPAPPR